MKRSYVSFDVFDTCLIRRCGRPYKIWDLMADRLFDKEDSRGRLSFTGNRPLAEKNVYHKNPYSSLNDIYEELNVSQWGFEKEQMMNLEMEIEEQELFPNPEILKIVNDYRKKDFVVVFISDMYLPTEFIKRILVKYDFCKEDERVFVSAACKAGKFNGSLFDFVLMETKSNARQWIHYGDNVDSDYRIPKKKGIKSFFVENTDFTKEEMRWMEDARFCAHKHEIELWTGLSRLTRLQKNKSFASTMAINLIASIYVPYVAYVCKVAKAKGIKVLYFLARDSHIFLEIAKTLNIEQDGIECRYLKLSRRSLHSCVFYDVNDFELNVTIENGINQSVEHILEYIDVEYKELSYETKSIFKAADVLNTSRELKDFSCSLKKYDAKLIKNRSSENRTLFLSYLEQECFFKKKAAMVDLGWVGSCRRIINYILKREGYESVPTFYWGYNSSLVYGDEFDELYVFNKQYDITQEYYWGNLFFEEYASLNERGTTIGYQNCDGRIVPVEKDVNESLKEDVLLNETSAKKFALNLIESKWNVDDALDDIFCICGLKQVSQILKNPSREQCIFFENIELENYGVKEKMVHRLSVKDFLALLVWGIPASLIWAEAAVVKSFGPFAKAYSKFYKYTSSTGLARCLRRWWDSRK